MDEETLRLPPQNLEAERAVLGSMVFGEEAAELAATILCANDFYRDNHRMAFRAITSLLKKKVPCDIITLGDELVRQGDFEEFGGPAYLVQIMEAVPTWAHTRYYAKIVKAESLRRQLIYAADKALKDAYNPSVEFEPLIAGLSDKLDDLIAERSAELIPISVHVQEMREEKLKPKYPYLTGIGELDEALKGGLRPVDLTIFAARPSIGKTSLGVQVAVNIAKSGAPVGILSIEMTALELVDRVSSRDPRAADELATLPVFIEDRICDLDDILNWIRMAKRRNNVKVFMIDYLQLIRVSQGRMQKHEQIEQAVKSLKLIAKELKIVMVVLAQINRGVDKREDIRPKLSDLKGSGAIEETADVAILLHRPEFYDEDDSPGIAEVHIAKFRHGPTSTLKLGYIKEKTMFVPYAQRPIDVTCYDADGKGPF